ncbi:MAG: efflux RND transporter periplasmic adaptor subunit [Phycisphaerae bacterium]
MKKAFVLIAGLGLIAAVFALNRLNPGDSERSLLHIADDDPLEVTVVTPQRQTIIRTVQAPGDLEAVLEVDIGSEIPAKIEEMPVEEGDAVEAGDLLCRLNDDAYRALVESGEAVVARLQASIRDAEADLTKVRRDVARQEHLAQMNATSDTELADYRTRLVKAQARVEERSQSLAEAQARLRNAREDLAKTVITSPIDGVVSKIQAEAGEVVVTGTMNNPGTVIMVVTDLSQMQVRARVDETDVPSVEPGQRADIFLPSEPDHPIPGRVLRVATSGNKPDGRDVVTFETLILVESDHSAVKPGMTTNVEIQVDRKENALTVPLQAVVHRKRKDLPPELIEQFDARRQELGTVVSESKAQYLKVIFCKDGDKAQPCLVRTGIADQRNVELLEGIAHDSAVIIGPYRSLDQLKDGTLVKLQEDEPKTAGEADDVSKLADGDGDVKPDDTPDPAKSAGQSKVAQAK